MTLLKARQRFKLQKPSAAAGSLLTNRMSWRPVCSAMRSKLKAPDFVAITVDTVPAADENVGFTGRLNSNVADVAGVFGLLLGQGGAEEDGEGEGDEGDAGHCWENVGFVGELGRWEVGRLVG